MSNQSNHIDINDKIKWTVNNSIPYILAWITPTALLIFNFIPALHWTIIFTLLIVGVGLVDAKAIDIAGSSVTFDQNDE
jgi:hypothetical protein